ACVIAAANGDGLFISHDDGVTFAELPIGDGSIAAITVDETGNVYALIEPGTLDVVHRDGSIETRALPFKVVDDDPPFAATGASLALFQGSTLATSDDRGATWRYRKPPVGADFEALRLESDGTIWIAESANDCESWSEQLHHGRASWKRDWTLGGFTLGQNESGVCHTDHAIGAHGWLYYQRSGDAGDGDVVVSP